MNFEHRITLMLVIVFVLLLIILVMEPAFVKTEQFQHLYEKGLHQAASPN